MIPLPTNHWTTKPPRQFTRLNLAHPLSRGLVDMWVFNNGGGNQPGLVHPERVFVATLGNFYLPWYQVGIEGPGAFTYVNNANGGYGYYSATNTSGVNYAAGDFTLRIRVEPITISDAYATLLSKSSAGGRELGFFFGSGNMDYMDVGGTTGVVSGSEGLYVGGLFDIVITRTTAGTVKSYVNGVVKSTLSTAFTGVAGQSAPLIIGWDQETQAHAAAWIYHELQIWNRVLSDQEIMSLTQDPYGTLMPPNTWALHGTFAAAGGFIAQQQKPILQAVNRASTY